MKHRPARSAVPLAAVAAGAWLLAWGAGTELPAQSPVKSSGFINAGAPYPQCHASTVVETSTRELVAAWFGGTREGAQDVGIWVARREDGRWLEAVEVANGRQPDGTRQPTWNPVLFQAPKGPLLLFFKAGPSPRQWWGMVTASSDGGRTWGLPERLPGDVLGPIKNKPVVLADGTWVCPSSTEHEPLGWRVRFELTRGARQAWQIVGPVDRGPALEAIQPTIFVHPAGRLQALCRTRNGVLAVTWSVDAGRTWTPLEKSDLPNPNSGVDGITLADGRHLLVYNHTAPPAGQPSRAVRYPLNVAVSPDGIRWQMVWTLEDQPMPAGYAYPAVIQSADGLVHVTYTWNRERIKHVVIDPKRLVGPARRAVGTGR